jgi:nucleoside-diphosphate-sugar epimerase
MPISDVKKTVLVTGGGGFIGSKLVHELLNKRCKVRVLDVQPGHLKGETERNLELIGIGGDELHGGIADKSLVNQAVKDVDVIYHLAVNWGVVAWTDSMNSLADSLDANIRGTINLLEAAKRCGARHFLFAGSCAVYGESESLRVDEETVCRPELSPMHLSAYGIMKLTNEKLCLMYYHHCGLPVTVFRIEVVFSDEESQLSALSKKYIDRVLSDKDIEVVKDEGCASVHVDEVVDAFLLATLNGKAYGQVFNVSNPATYITHDELYRLIIQLTGSRSKIKRIQSAPRISCIPESVEKIQNLLGWRPRKTKEDLKKAVAQTVKSMAK